MLLVSFAGADAGNRPRPESNCSGNDADQSCQVGPPSGTVADHGSADDGIADLAAANLATAAFQDVAQAEAAGYVSTLDTLGCFEDPQRGGMGLHYTNEALIDATLDVTAPEALLYELDAAGQITALVAHEYIVPIEVWDDERAAATVRTRPPSASLAASVDSPHLDLEGEPDGSIRGLQPTRPAMPRRRPRVRRRPPPMSQRCT